MNRIPAPPVIDSARLLAYAFNDLDVEFTDRINLFIGKAGEMTKLGEVPNLAICESFGSKDILLLLCDESWNSEGVIGEFASVERAKQKAETGYRGVSDKFIPSPYSQEEENQFLLKEYSVDPDTNWWESICSFCGASPAKFRSTRASICEACIVAFAKDA